MSPRFPRTAETMEQDLRALIATVQNPHLSVLLDRALGPGTPTWLAFRAAPAAKRYHQAYRHGLLEHTLLVAESASALSAIYPELDRDLVLTGALIHDIGKLETYTEVDGQIEMTDAGRLHGEIALGYARIHTEIESIAGFPHELAQALLHIVLSHHGALEYGSPVVPSTREATLVHMADSLSAKLGSFDRIERALDADARWAGYDNGLGACAYFGADRSRTGRHALAA
ncbi:MAG: HD domain-containing protein [Solirubrobacteraceae bacterium]